MNCIISLEQNATSYTDEQVELMGNLAPFMANGFAQTAKTRDKTNVVKIVN